MAAATAQSRARETAKVNRRTSDVESSRSAEQRGAQPRATEARGELAFPVDDVIGELRKALNTASNAVLEAPPGAGKTTRVPIALLHEPWLGTQRMVMLEPRRLAARAAANFMARQLGERVGETVGFRVRGETRVSSRTRIEVVTEGILTRMLSSDSTLDGIGLVIFDEFHERSLHADVGLALTLQTQSLLRPELRVLVMSATLDGNSVRALLSDATSVAPVVRSTGRMFPVETLYRPKRTDERIEAAVARATVEAVQQHAGDVLVFLPGAGEQRRVAERLHGHAALVHANAYVSQLHGTMPLAEQDVAISAAPPGERKIVLATSIAETSLTIEGVRVVVDSGLSRLARYSARAGITKLETVRVSRASADQRRGRAGRVAPGVCIRVWDAHEDAMLVPRTRPEILEADLAPLALSLADVGVSDPAELRWIDSPPAGAFLQARELLQMLGAIDSDARITAHGRILADIPAHPRLAHLLVKAREQGEGHLGADLCALIEERDVLRGEYGPPVADLRLRLELLQGVSPAALSASLSGAQVDGDSVRRIRQVAADLRARLRENANDEVRSDTSRRTRNADDAATLLALGYPDRVAQRRAGSDPRYLLRSGVGASLLRHDPLADAPFLAIADLDGAPPEFRIARAIPLTRDEVFATLGAQIVRESVVEWDDTSRSVRARRRALLGAIVLEDHVVATSDGALVLRVLMREIVRSGIDTLPWSDSAQHLRERLQFMHAHDNRWPDISAEALAANIEQWLAPSIEGMRRWDELTKVDLPDALLSLLTWEQRASLEKLAPSHLEVPSGSRIALDYSNPHAPVLAVKLQEVFGWTATPLLLDGRVPVTLHLLSPAQRPVQVTRDLAGFWRTSYFDVRKDLRGRYPRHPWPEDPLTAQPTRRAKPRGT
jgi:ATP-dependent helicase HrpB